MLVDGDFPGSNVSTATKQFQRVGWGEKEIWRCTPIRFNRTQHQTNDKKILFQGKKN